MMGACPQVFKVAAKFPSQSVYPAQVSSVLHRCRWQVLRRTQASARTKTDCGQRCVPARALAWRALFPRHGGRGALLTECVHCARTRFDWWKRYCRQRTWSCAEPVGRAPGSQGCFAKVAAAGGPLRARLPQRDVAVLLRPRRLPCWRRLYDRGRRAGCSRKRGRACSRPACRR